MRRAIYFQNPNNSLFFDRRSPRCYAVATPGVELLATNLNLDDVAYNLYVGMVTFRPDGYEWISELQGVELQTGR